MEGWEGHGVVWWVGVGHACLARNTGSSGVAFWLWLRACDAEARVRPVRRGKSVLKCAGRGERRGRAPVERGRFSLLFLGSCRKKWWIWMPVFVVHGSFLAIKSSDCVMNRWQ